MARTITVTPDGGFVVDVVEDGMPPYRDKIHAAEAQGKNMAQLRALAAARHDAWKSRLAAAARAPRPSRAERLAEVREQIAALRQAEMDIGNEAED